MKLTPFCQLFVSVGYWLGRRVFVYNSGKGGVDIVWFVVGFACVFGW